MKLESLIEQQLNRILALDEETLEQLAALSGQVILLELLNTGTRFYIYPASSGLRLESEADDKADVVIRGTPTELLAYMLRPGKPGAKPAGNIEVIGDVALAQSFQAIMLALDPDWEEMLAGWFGDPLAHRLGRFMKGGLSVARDTQEKFQADLSEYLRFEKELTVEKSEMSEFVRDVDVLRDDIERLHLRIKRLETPVRKD